MSLSCIDIGRPTEYEKCRSMMYSVHQRFLHRATTSAPSCSSDSCVCSPSYCAIRMACPSFARHRHQQVYNITGGIVYLRKCTPTLFGLWNRNKARPEPALQLPVGCPSTRTHGQASATSRARRTPRQAACRFSFDTGRPFQRRERGGTVYTKAGDRWPS